MKLIVLNISLFTAMLLCVNVYAQEQYWPEVFGDPDVSDAEKIAATDTFISNESIMVEAPTLPDSSVVELYGKSSLLTTFNALSKLQWQRLLPHGELNQLVSYQYSQQNPQNRIQTVDASGSVMFENVLNKGFDAGFLWSPVASYDRDTIGALRSIVDMGPMVAGTVYGFPYLVKGGLHGYIWNDSITPWLLSTTDGRYSATPGVFGGFSCGSEDGPLLPLPLQFSLNASGHTAGGNGVGHIQTGFLYADETTIFGGGDSLYCAIGDSITNGKEIDIGEYDGSSFYSNTSWRVNHIFSTTAGIRLRQRFATVLRAYYRFNQHSISYPNEASQLSDSRNRTNTFGLSARTKRDRPVVYTGGVEFDWEYENKIFKRSFEQDDVPKAEEFTTYIINQGDHFNDRARSDHDVALALPAGLSVRYHLAAIKNSKKYPFVFRDTLFELRRNEDENDYVQTNHLLSFCYDRDSSVNIELYGKYWRKYHYYYHENRTADSKKVNEYRSGINAQLTFGPVSVSEHFYMDAEISDYYFKRVGDIPVDAPPYNRNVSSSLLGTWRLSNQLSLNGNWVNIYSDEGYWYGNAYRVKSAAGKEFYAVESKRSQYWLEFWFKYVTDHGDTLSIGSKFNDIYRRKYDFSAAEYRISSLDIGYGIEPYVKAEIDREKYGGILYLRRIFNTRDAERWSKRKNWELSLSFWLSW